MNDQPSATISKRMVFIGVSLMDTVIGAVILLIYFGLLPVDTSNWEIPRWILGAVGAVWFMAALGVLVYQLTKTESSE